MTPTAQPSKPVAGNSGNDAIIERARKRWSASVSAEREIRAEAEMDARFVLGDQWQEASKIRRGRADRPVLVFNKLHTQVNQLSNQARQSKPAVTVHPAGSGADRQLADVYQGLWRHIEYESNADICYDTALDSAGAVSFGWLKLDCRYSDDKSFDQDLVIMPVWDAFSVRMDCDAKRHDKSDSMWGFEEEWLSRSGYAEQFGHEYEGSDETETDTELRWFAPGEAGSEDRIRVCRYWEVTLEEKTLREYIGPDGVRHAAYLEDLSAEEIDSYEWTVDQNDNIRERTVEIRHVCQYIIDGHDVLDEIEWDGSHIPLVPVYGKMMVVKGKVHLISLIRYSRDPQKLHNYYKTAEAEIISLAPKPRWVGAVGQFKTKKKDWQRANVDFAAFLEYDLVANGDKMAPPPTWVTFDPPVNALNIGALSTADDIKSGTGYFDPSLGQQQIKDQSGVALQQLAARGDISNFHFIDNLSHAIRTLGQYGIELFPLKYNTAREIQILRDNKQEVITINAPYVDSSGKHQHHEMDKGKYSLVVSMGASSETGRMQTRQMLIEMSQTSPIIAQLAAPIICENSDFQGADKLARWLMATLPPAVQQAEAAAQQGISPELQQAQGQIQQLQAQLTQINQVLQTKVLQYESEERRNTQSNIVKLLAAEAASKQAGAAQQFQATVGYANSEMQRKADMLDRLLTLYAEGQQAGLDREHEARLQQVGAQQAAAQQAGSPSSPSPAPGQ